MKRTLIILIVVAAAAGGSLAFYNRVLGGTFRITPEHPLGTAERMRSVVVSYGFEERETETKEIEELDMTVEITHYVDAFTEEKYSFAEAVLIMVDDEDELRGVSAVFMKAPDTAVSSPRTAIRFFIFDYWEAAGGDPDPRFKAKRVGSGLLAQYRREARFSTDKVEGLWRRSGPGQTIMVYSK